MNTDENFSNATRPLYLRSQVGQAPQTEVDPFQGDLYERKQLAERLTRLLDRFPDGAVIAIDSAWGDGKSWFGQRWKASLIQQGFRTAYIDCFQKDHVEDPFLLLVSEMLKLVKTQDNNLVQTFRDYSRIATRSLLPFASKVALKAVGHIMLGNAEIEKDFKECLEAANDDASAGIEKWLDHRIEEQEAEQSTIDNFKDALTKLALAHNKPIVIFVDELDRCRPDFSVRMIERIKHFFDVPKVIFVLLINRQQLSAAIRGTYGHDIDADAYLSKFIQLGLRLPKRLSIDEPHVDANRRYCDHMLVRHGLAKGWAMMFTTSLGIIATCLEFSLRDIERATTLYAYASIELDERLSGSAKVNEITKKFNTIIAWPIAIKVSRPHLYDRLLKDHPSAHSEAEKLLKEIVDRIGKDKLPILSLLSELHLLGSSSYKGSYSQTLHVLSVELCNGPPDTLNQWLFGQIDLPVV